MQYSFILFYFLPQIPQDDPLEIILICRVGALLFINLFFLFAT